MTKVIIFLLVVYLKFIFCKELGDQCKLPTNSKEEDGICKLATDCIDYFKVNKNIKICGFQNRESIICCPSFTNETHQEKDTFNAQQFNPECIVDKTNEKGFYKLIKHCPRIAEEVRNGAPFPTVCKYEVCEDLVCCPVGGLKRKNEVCAGYDEADYNIRNRINQESPCKTNGKNGVILSIENCPTAKEIIKNGGKISKICDYNFCEEKVCCPSDDYKNGVSNRRSYEDPIFTYTKFEAGDCTDNKTGQKGVCTIWQNCEYASTTHNYTICGFDNCNMFVCCPHRKYDAISLQACEVYKETVFEFIRVSLLDPTRNKNVSCSAISPSGGYFASPKQFPHIAALGYTTEEGKDIWNCGGSLISDRYILTAAHCVNTAHFGSVEKVLLGTITLNSPENYSCPEEFNVIERNVHPKYNASERYNDIALLKLDRKVNFNPHIRPACLPSSNEIAIDQQFTAMGWGQTGFAAPRTNWLIFVGIEKFDHKVCSEIFKGANKLPLGILEETQLCAGSRYSIDDTCPGDSGGPLQIYKNYLMAEIVGITSFGNACGFQNSPAVYTKVYPYVKWIESIVWN